MPVFQNILQAIGNVPLVRLNKVVGPEDAAVYAKCEFLEPGGSIKDRMALAAAAFHPASGVRTRSNWMRTCLVIGRLGAPFTVWVVVMIPGAYFMLKFNVEKLFGSN